MGHMLTQIDDFGTRERRHVTGLYYALTSTATVIQMKVIPMLKRNIPNSAAGAATFLAAETKIVGTLSGKGAYIFCGEVEGECDINGPVTIAEGSHWKGAIRATEIIIAGSVEGDVAAKRRVELAETARVSGSLRGSSIVVAEGAVIEGDVRITAVKETENSKVTAQLYATPAKC